MSASPPTAGTPPRGWVSRAAPLVIAAVLLAVLCAVVLLSGTSAGFRSTFSQTALVVGGVLVGFSCAFRARRTRSRRRRRAWRLMGAAGPTAAAVNLLSLLAGETASETIQLVVNAGLLMATIFGVVGMSVFPSARHTPVQLARMLLDGLVVGGAALFTTTVIVFHDDETVGQLSQNPEILLLPLVDVVVATVAVLLILRSNRSDRYRLGLLVIGFVLYAVSDLGFVVQLSNGGQAFGTVYDLGWILGYLSLALTALLPDRPAELQRSVVRESSPVFGTVLVVILFLGAGLTAVIAGSMGLLTPLSRLVWLLTLIAVGARQILLVVDNDRLTGRLSARVSERTLELRQVTRQTSLMVDSVDDGIYGVDRDGAVTFLNPAAARLLGHSVEQLVGRSAHLSFHARQEDGSPYPEENCYIAEAVRDGRATTAEQDVYVRSDGQRVAVEVTASPLRDGEATQGAVVVFRDMTERREVERVKDEFVSVVSHELRTPLTAIRGSLGLLAGGALGALQPRAQQMVDMALQSSDRLTRLINDILDMERLGSNTLPMELAEVDVAELVEAAVAQVEVLPAASGLRLQVGSVEGVVWGDRDRLLQTLLNLLGNALKYAPPGSAVEVDASVVGSFVQLRVTDHGRGIPADMLERVFGRFQQVDSSDAREKGGSGLGLAISRTIVERHGGRIWVESDPGRRTTFQFTVPVAESGDTVSDGATVVVCDDDEYVLQVVSEWLRSRGYVVLEAADGWTALELVQLERPAALLVDVTMAGMSGVEVVERLRARPETESLPVVVISGIPARDRPGLHRQVDAWLAKPLDERLLARALSRAVRRRPQQRTVLLVETDDEVVAEMVSRLAGHGLLVQHAAGQDRALHALEGPVPALVAISTDVDGGGQRLTAELRGQGRLAGVPVLRYQPGQGTDVLVEQLVEQLRPATSDGARARSPDRSPLDSTLTTSPPKDSAG